MENEKLEQLIADDRHSETNSQAPAAPAGWYPDQDGLQRYWDGENWLSIPPPPNVLAGNSTPANYRTTKNSKRKILIPALALVVALGIGGAAITIVSANRAAAEEYAAEAARIEQQEQERQEREAERERQAAERQAERERAEAERLAEIDRRILEIRQSAIPEIEDSIREMAEGHAARRIIRGPVLSVSCTPVAGGTIALEAESTVFSCFVATRNAGGSRYYGYHYNATMNWNTFQFTFGLGAP